MHTTMTHQQRHSKNWSTKRDQPVPHSVNGRTINPSGCPVLHPRQLFPDHHEANIESPLWDQEQGREKILLKEIYDWLRFTRKKSELTQGLG